MRIAPVGPKNRGGLFSQFCYQGAQQAGVPFTSFKVSSRKTGRWYYS